MNEEQVPDSDIKQVWFAGVHSDIGGSYAEKDSGLSKLTLEWMIIEAKEKGLQVNIEKYKGVVLGEEEGYAKPDYNAIMHKSLKSFWWGLEIFPRKLYNPSLGKKQYKWAFGKYRFISENALIHQSALDKEDNSNYEIVNKPEHFRIEPYSKRLEVL